MGRGLRRRSPPPPGKGSCSRIHPSKATVASSERQLRLLLRLLLLWRSVGVVLVVAPHAPAAAPGLVVALAAAAWTTTPLATSTTRLLAPAAAATAAAAHRQHGLTVNPLPFGFGCYCRRGSTTREISSVLAGLRSRCLQHRRLVPLRLLGCRCNDGVLHASAAGPHIDCRHCGYSKLEDDSTDQVDLHDPERRHNVLDPPSYQQPTLGNPPYLAIVTEPDSCRTEERLQQALQGLAKALLPKSSNDEDVASGIGGARLGGRGVNLVIVRLDDDDDDDESGEAAQLYRRRVSRFVRTLVEWSTMEGSDRNGKEGSGGDKDNTSERQQRRHSPSRPPRFLVLVSSGLLLGDDPPLLDQHLGAHGVHVKESHRSRLPDLVERLGNHRNSAAGEVVGDEGGGMPTTRRSRANVVVGMSCHSVESAVEAMQQQYRPDYLLVGTCYPTLSHPEKSPTEVEGPQLPGQVKRGLERWILDDCDDDDDNDDNDPQRRRRPIVLGIGGIDSNNCGRVVRAGADGVAVIRSVLAKPDPAAAVRCIHDEMRRCAWSGSEPTL